jgi:hypothetical protein
MRGLGLLIVLMPFTGRAQDYANATNAAWCAGALGAYARRPLQSGATYLDSAQSKKLAYRSNDCSAREGLGALSYLV